MKSLYEYINESILDDDLDKKTGGMFDNMPYMYKPEKKWKFKYLQLGKLYNYKGQVGFYSHYSDNRHNNVILILRPDEYERWVDHPSEDFDRVYIANAAVRSVASRAIGVNFTEDDVMIQNCNDYLHSVKETDMSITHEDERDWDNFMKAFEKFFRITRKSK